MLFLFAFLVDPLHKRLPFPQRELRGAVFFGGILSRSPSFVGLLSLRRFSPAACRFVARRALLLPVQQAMTTFWFPSFRWTQKRFLSEVPSLFSQGPKLVNSHAASKLLFFPSENFVAVAISIKFFKVGVSQRALFVSPPPHIPM